MKSARASKYQPDLGLVGDGGRSTLMGRTERGEEEKIDEMVDKRGE